TGLPDPTGLWFAAEGALGVVTRVAVRARARAHRCQLSFRAPTLAAVLPLAEALRVPGLYETFRAVDPGDPGEPGRPALVEVDVVLCSSISAAELDGRVAWVTERIDSLIPGVSSIEQRRERPDESTLLRFWGDAGQAWVHTREGRFAPVDVNLGYPAAGPALARAELLLHEHRELPWINLRSALYFAPEFVNFGLHWSLD